MVSVCRVELAQSRFGHSSIKIIAGKGKLDDLDQLEKLCALVQKTSLCGLGVSAPNPVVSTLKYFRHEYESLINVDHSSATSAN